MPKLRPLELSDTALEPRRAHGQRRRGASAQRWRGAHSVAAAGAAGRFCSELTLRSELPPTSQVATTAPSITAQPLVEMAAAALPAGSVALVVTLEIKPDRIEVHAQRICLSAPVLLRAWTAPGRPSRLPATELAGRPDSAD